MIHNFENMFDGDTIKHFDMRHATSYTLYCYEDVNEKLNHEIQIPLIEWIKKEYENNRLFEVSNWRAFRVVHEYNDIYTGYNKLFKYKQYYFQLVIEDHWCDSFECRYCPKESNRIHFEVALFGWKENDILEPDKIYNIEDDDMICKRFWELNIKYKDIV